MATQLAVAPAFGRVHLRRILIGALVIVVIGAVATLAGWDITAWFKHICPSSLSPRLGGILFAIVLLIKAFGWSDGKTLVSQSYGQAREKNAEQSAARKARREAKCQAETPG
ncbi:MAG: hypothetical protein WBQ21_05240 [Solirubrobacteraceae bacterium]